ncbi:hypothetical protein H0H92_011218 [Tricholoma furcatifolium]|nr:hypothetical protein H0H92_011218 [Tricholoma furcatifolium]
MRKDQHSGHLQPSAGATPIRLRGTYSEASILLDDGVHQLLLKTFHSQSEPTSCGFTIGDAGEKGEGMFALRDLSTGSLILVEHPVLVVPYLIGLDVPLTDIYAAMLDGLPRELSDGFLQLSGGPDHNLESIVRLNALGIQLEVPDVPHAELTTHRALFLNTSKCNHSCGPNARWEWDTSTFRLFLSAVRPIMEGEEITIHYAPCTLPRHERHAILWDRYAFTCHCSYCSLSNDAVLYSDETRTSLGDFWSTLPSFEAWCLDSTLPDDMLIKLHIEALQMIKQEDLQVLDSERHVDAIAMCYGALADPEMFQAWAQRVRDAKVNLDPAQALVFVKWLSNPASFPAWGWKSTFSGRK